MKAMKVFVALLSAAVLGLGVIVVLLLGLRSQGITNAQLIKQTYWPRQPAESRFGLPCRHVLVPFIGHETDRDLATCDQGDVYRYENERWHLIGNRKTLPADSPLLQRRPGPNYAPKLDCGHELARLIKGKPAYMWCVKGDEFRNSSGDPLDWKPVVPPDPMPPANH